MPSIKNFLFGKTQHPWLVNLCNAWFKEIGILVSLWLDNQAFLLFRKLPMFYYLKFKLDSASDCLQPFQLIKLLKRWSKFCSKIYPMELKLISLTVEQLQDGTALIMNLILAKLWSKPQNFSSKTVCAASVWEEQFLWWACFKKYGQEDHSW
jgi:hypothetical protein